MQLFSCSIGGKGESIGGGRADWQVSIGAKYGEGRSEDNIRISLCILDDYIFKHYLYLVQGIPYTWWERKKAWLLHLFFKKYVIFSMHTAGVVLSSYQRVWRYEFSPPDWCPEGHPKGGEAHTFTPFDRMNNIIFKEGSEIRFFSIYNLL